MTPVTEVVTHSLDQYAPVVGAAEVDELRTLAQPLEGSTVEMVNSTAVGGGVAELLTRLLPLMRELGLQARSDVMEADLPFFEVTKAFHNGLHGSAYRAKDRTTLKSSASTIAAIASVSLWTRVLSSFTILSRRL
jgi:hypothetical protein